ncbi:MAG TPA: hypothetical protein VJ867_07465 [Gemmatimonadaceae bacterium]|nr:hypothetical protein [Gemmatimonadaceae bacterium]
MASLRAGALPDAVRRVAAGQQLASESQAPLGAPALASSAAPREQRAAVESASVSTPMRAAGRWAASMAGPRASARAWSAAEPRVPGVADWPAWAAWVAQPVAELAPLVPTVGEIPPRLQPLAIPSPGSDWPVAGAQTSAPDAAE